MKLYELTEAYQNIWKLVEDEESDLDILERALQSVEANINEKVENTAKLIKNIKAEAEMIKLEEQRLASRRRSMENKEARIKAYIEEQLKVAGIDKVKTTLFTVGFQNNPPSVELVCEELIPEKYVIITKNFDKKAILADIKAGVLVPGAEIKQTRSLRIR